MSQNDEVVDLTNTPSSSSGDNFSTSELLELVQIEELDQPEGFPPSVLLAYVPQPSTSGSTHYDMPGVPILTPNPGSDSELPSVPVLPPIPDTPDSPDSPDSPASPASPDELSDSDVEIVEETPVRDDQFLLDIYHMTSQFYQPFLNNQNYLTYKVLWELPVYSVRGLPRYTRPRPIAVEMIREVTNDFELSLESDLERIEEQTYIIKVAFVDRTKNRLRIFRNYARLNKTSKTDKVRELYFFNGKKFMQAVSALHPDIELFYMKEAEGNTVSWPIHFNGLTPVVDDVVENLFPDNSEELLRTLLCDFDEFLHQRHVAKLEEEVL